MKATSNRRRLIVLVLLGLAVLGGLARLWAPDPSLARDIGTLLLVLWLPVVGNVVAFLIRKARERMRPVTAFAAGAPFVPHLWVQLEPAEPPPGWEARPDGEICTLVLGSEGFTARLGLPLAGWHVRGQVDSAELQFLRPAVALRRFPVATRFSVIVNGQVVGTGRVLGTAGRVRSVAAGV
ncbi:MAG: hypothetical protein ABIR26_06675 [Ramlibacter sp.]